MSFEYVHLSRFGTRLASRRWNLNGRVLEAS